MDFTLLLNYQKGLDQHIIEKHNLQDQFLLEGKILALNVELGELANETRCFKFWSVKPPSPKAVILEEFVDGVHFLLSIALEIQDRITFPHSDIHAVLTADNLTEQFNEVYAAIARFNKVAFCSAVSLESEFTEIWCLYLGLGELLGFSQEEIEEYYVYKNHKNHERQENNY